MDSVFRRGKLALVLALLLAPGVFAQTPAPVPSQGHFYDVDKEVRIEGSVLDVRMEPRYESRAPFLVVDLEEKGTRRTIRVEVSPAWFFGQDVHKGERLKIVGSPYGDGTAVVNLIAREVQLRGETIRVRDKNGFPSWSGGARGKRRMGPGG